MSKTLADPVDIDEVAELLNTARRVDRLLTAALAEDNLRVDQWRILRALSRTSGMLMGELSAELGMAPASVTRFIDEMSDSGFVFRRPSPDDGRKAAVYISRMGQSRLERAAMIVATRLGSRSPA